MSTSFVKYRGHGFWSWDGYLEHVLSLLADRIGKSPSEVWLADLSDHWRAQSSGAFRGLIDPKLDEFVTTDGRGEVLLAFLEDIKSQPGLTPEAEQTARFLEMLLRGQMNTDESSPLDYMVSGTHPYKRSIK